MSPAKRLSRKRFRARMARANAMVTVYELFGFGMGESRAYVRSDVPPQWVRLLPNGRLAR